MPQAGKLQTMASGTAEPSDLTYHRSRHAAAQHRFHCIERGGIAVRLNYYEPPRIKPECQQSGAVEVRAGGDPERRPDAVDTGQQKGDKGGGKGAGFGFQPLGSNFVQLPERQAAAWQAGIDGRIAKCKTDRGGHDWPQTVLQAS